MSYSITTTKAERKFRRNRDAIRRAQIVQQIPAYTINGDPLLNTVEAAAYLSLSVQTLSRWRSQFPDRLPFVKVGGSRVRYRRSALDAHINAHTVTDGRGVKS
jgi:excisionase family DNA binding protein